MRGYSLIELLLALAISALLGASALPLFHQQTSSLLLQQEVVHWLSYLQQVKAKSQKDGSSVVVDLPSLARQTGTRRVHFESTYRASSPLTFYGESATANPGHIKLSTDKRVVKVIISNIARVRACLSHGSPLSGLPQC